MDKLVYLSGAQADTFAHALRDDDLKLGRQYYGIHIDLLLVLRLSGRYGDVNSASTTRAVRLLKLIPRATFIYEAMSFTIEPPFSQVQE